MIPKLYHPIGILFLSLFCNQIAFADFSLVCPPDVTVSCREDYLHDLNVFGKAYTNWNGIISYQHDCKTTIEIDDCGKGTIKRVWGVENPENWKWLTCVQVITISNANGFVYSDIEWPLSIVIRSCDPQSDFKHLQAPYDAPHWTSPKCAKPMVSFKDSHFKVDDGCEKVIREWKVLDWCQYDPVNYPGRGIFSYTQVIKLISVSDSIQLLCKKDTVVFNNRTCDTIYVNLDSAVFQSGCKIYNRIYNTSKYALRPNANASGYYPNGITKFYYIAEYACGTEVKCEVTVDVRNKIQPTPYCLTGVVLTLMPVDANNDGTVDDGMITVWASDLDKGSWHKCPGQKLNFSFSKDILDKSRTYTCSDVGTNDVEIWVTDTLGNQDVCKTQIIIQNNNPSIPNCDGNLQGGKMSVRGKVMFYNTIAPSKLQISINSSAQGFQAEPDKNNNYEFQFNDLIGNQSYMIQSSFQSFIAAALDYDDLSYLKKLIDKKVKPASPYIILAADVNQDHEINTLDYNLLKQVIYYKRSAALKTNWIFLPEGFTFNNPSDPLKEVMPNGIEIQKLEHDMDNQNLLAIRVGDLVFSTTNTPDWAVRRNDADDRFQLELIHCSVINDNGDASSITWTLNSSISQTVSIQLFSIDGRELINKSVKLSEGIQKVTLEATTKGLLIYNIRYGNSNISNKLFSY